MSGNGSLFFTECNRKQTLDRRRESSRFAARDRRGKEADIFTDLRLVVPIVDEATATHVDRIAILRVALTFCRLRKVATKFLRSNLGKECEYLWSEKTLVECLDGFLAIVDLDGIILYVSESVSVYLGLTQTDLTGRSLKEFIHATDYEEYVGCGTGSTGSTTNRGCGRVKTLRMKAVISPRGRNLNLRNALFKPIICHIRSLSAENGRVRIIQASSQPAGQGSGVFPASRTAEVQNGTYMTRHTFDMKFSYVSESFNFILRHDSRSLMGTSFYNLVHPADLDVVVVSIREMLTKGHTRTPYYRLIGLNKSVLWVQTEATTVNHIAKGQKGQYVICVHQLIGTQSERDSFMSGKDTSAAFYPTLMPIKQEMNDSSELMKSSYNEVLQWLFRAQQRSRSPGALLFRAESNKNISTSFFGDRLEHSRESARYKSSMTPRIENLSGTKNSFAFSVNNDYVHGNNSDILPHNGNGTNNMRANCSGGPANGNVPDCSSNHCFQTDFAESQAGAIFNTVRLSAASAADTCLISQNSINSATTTGTARNPGNMLPTLSPLSTQYSRSLTFCDPYLNNSFTSAVATSSNFLISSNNNTNHTQPNIPVSPVNYVAEIPRVAHDKENHSNDTIEGGDDWQLFAPFVAPDDMMQLSTDLQGLLPEFSFADWIPSDPAPLPSLPTEERGVTLVGNVSIPMQMTFDRSNVYANSNISLLSKPNPFGLTATSWRQLQQQCQNRHHDNENIETATAPWLGIELSASTRSSDYHPTGMLNRNSSASSIQ